MKVGKRHLCSNIGILALFGNFELRLFQKPKQILRGNISAYY
jgi:hypothetical protein